VISLAENVRGLRLILKQVGQRASVASVLEAHRSVQFQKKEMLFEVERTTHSLEDESIAE
jgi:hypothetical protein